MTYITLDSNTFLEKKKPKETGAGEVRTDYGERPTAGEGVVDPTKEPGFDVAQETGVWTKPDETTGISTYTDPVTKTESIYQGEPQLPEMDDEGNILTQGATTAQTSGGGYGKKRIGEQSRKQANLTGSRGSSILTSQ